MCVCVCVCVCVLIAFGAREGKEENHNLCMPVSGTCRVPSGKFKMNNPSSSSHMQGLKDTESYAFIFQVMLLSARKIEAHTSVVPD